MKFQNYNTTFINILPFCKTCVLLSLPLFSSRVRLFKTYLSIILIKEHASTKIASAIYWILQNESEEYMYCIHVHQHALYENLLEICRHYLCYMFSILFEKVGHFDALLNAKYMLERFQKSINKKKIFLEIFGHVVFMSKKHHKYNNVKIIHSILAFKLFRC